MAGFSQGDFLVFKKTHQTLATYTKGSYITFQLRSGQWMQGIITKISNDSFELKQEFISHGMRNDTTHVSGFHFTIADVYAMPKRGVQIDYINNRYQVTMSGGHVHWYWIKSGWIFRVGAAGYAALNIFNGIIQNNFSFRGSHLGIAAGIFAGGVLLKRSYRPAWRMGHKYRLETIRV